MIDITYSLSEAEYLDGYKIWAKLQLKTYPGRVLVQIASAVFGVFIGLSLHLLPTWLWIGLIASYGLLYFVCWWRKKVIRKHLYAQSKENWQNMHVKFDELGYQSELPGMSGGWIRWARFTNWREGKLVIILGYDVHFIPIPRSALAPEQQDELRLLIASHVKSST